MITKKIILILSFSSILFGKQNYEINHNYLDNQIKISINHFENLRDEYIKKNYFEGEHIDEISKKLNKYLNSTLKNKGKFITEYSLEVGIDPYLVTSVMLQETGCYWNCSYLTRTCNNVGGNKGKPGCNGGSYRKFDTIEDGIKFAIDKLNSYYKKGLTTPQKIGPKYATDPKWASRVNSYMKKLKKQ